jgi:hypothetical protein
MFRKPLADFLLNRFPRMADSHFGSIAKDKADRREFQQHKDLELLRSDLAAAEAARKTAEVNNRQQIERERTYTAIIDNQFIFMQKLVDTQLISVEASIVTEIKSLKMSFDRLARQVRGDDTTQNILLKRLGGDDE